MTLKKNLALFFMIFFMLINSAPTILLSIDNSIDSSTIMGLGEEEEKEDIKLLFEFPSNDIEETTVKLVNLIDVDHTSKTYIKPHLNLIFPPPESSLA